MTHQDRHKPPLSFSFLTRIYDPIIRWTMPEAAFRERLVTEVGAKDFDRILDVGCGTGTLACEVVKICPEAIVVGLDADSKALQMAITKSTMNPSRVNWVRAFGQGLPFSDQSFDKVMTSLFFHHLTPKLKTCVFEEIYRILHPGGEIYLADWGKPHGFFMRLAFLPVQVLDGFETTTDNVRGMLPALMEEVGFKNVRQITRYRTVFGTLALYRGRKTG